MKGWMRRNAVVLVAACAAIGCRPAAETPSTSEPVVSSKVKAPGLHNVYRVSDKLYSGGGPEGDAGFESLQKLGVKTVLSVDGAQPDVERARRHGLRYVHLPVRYDGITREQALRLARAVRDLPGPVYLHCHHGKHRGPAAAALIHLCLDERCRVEDALAEMKRAGTDPRYKGLYAAPAALRRPAREELDGVPAEFPEAARVAALAQAMVGVEERWEHLKQVKAAGWRKPADHPDVDPPHEALQLAEHYRESARLPEMRARPGEFRTWLAEAEQEAMALEKSLRKGKENSVKPEEADKLFGQAERSCIRCHVKFRDVPQGP